MCARSDSDIPIAKRKIVVDATTSGPNYKFSVTLAYRVCRTVAGSVWPANPSVQLANTTVRHEMKKMSASIERYHGSSCSCGHSRRPTSAKKFKNLRRKSFLLPPPSPTVPRHDRPSQDGATSTVCVFPSLVTSESLGSHFTCDQGREHDATAHDTHTPSERMFHLFAIAVADVARDTTCLTL